MSTIIWKGMVTMVFKPKGGCSREIQIETDGNVIKEVKFVGGCMGNTIGISRLVEGLKIEDAIARLEGIDCGG